MITPKEKEYRCERCKQPIYKERAMYTKREFGQYLCNGYCEGFQRAFLKESH